MSMMRFATRERPDSLAAIVSLLASPKVEKVDENAPGTNQNPVVVDARMLMPRALDQLFLAAASATDDRPSRCPRGHARRTPGESRVAFAERADAEGRVARARSVDTLLSTASLARFEPARMQGLPVAVNMIWLVANTTVRAPKAALEMPVTGAPIVDGPSPRKRRVDVVLPGATSPFLDSRSSSNPQTCRRGTHRRV
jgi:hypothetical protein